MILFLEPYFEKKPWAGEDLQKIYDCPEQTGEAWIVSGYKRKSSRIKNGKYKGQTLRNLWISHPELFGNFPDKEFPLLLKLISSQENLSVQVHPNDDYALKTVNQLGKYECWYILPETKSNTVTMGVNVQNAAELKRVISEGKLETFLIKKEIKPNNLIVVEPGRVHAIHGQTFLLEVQESSDITYRLFDYNRVPKRQLHIEDSLNVVNYNNKRKFVFDFTSEDSLKNEHFNLYKLTVDKEMKYENKGFEIFYVLNGEGKISGSPIKKGDSFIITNVKNSFTVEGNLDLIAVVPKPKNKERLRMRKVAFITGIVGQDGIYLTKLLLSKDYEIHGLIQSKAQMESSLIYNLITDDKIYNHNLFLHIGDMTDASNLNRILEKIKPDEIYHLASQSHVDLSFEMPEYTTQVNALGTLRLLDAIKSSEIRTKLFHLSSPYLFSGEIYPQNESIPFDPKSPYAISKLYAHYMVKSYRENYNLFAVNGICYNHESKMRDTSFVSMKVISHLKNKSKEVLKLGNLDAMREWGHAEDYANAMWLMLQQVEPNDFVISTGKAHTIRHFVSKAFEKIGVDVYWRGTGVDEKCYEKNTNQILVEIDSSLIRPNDAKVLVGDSTLFQMKTGWEPKYDLDRLLESMLEDEEC